MVSISKLCPLDGEPDTEAHNLLRVNTTINGILEDHEEKTSELKLSDVQRGALLHALDELQGLAEKLGIEGFQHFDG